MRGQSHCLIARCGSQSHCRSLQAALDELLRDYANPNMGDKYFTFARHMDWFEGHSWAGGIVAFGDGRNQVRVPAPPSGYSRVYIAEPCIGFDLGCIVYVNGLRIPDSISSPTIAVWAGTLDNNVSHTFKIDNHM